MQILMIVLGVLAVAGVWFLTRRSPSRPPQERLPQAGATAARPAAPTGTAPAAAAAAAATPTATKALPPAVREPIAAALSVPLPAVLSGWNWTTADALEPTRRDALTQALREIPRPPGALHQLVSPQFLDRASSAELNELIGAEAQLAAKVLATVNSPAYGLQKPVASIGQAVTFLGLNAVRGLCVQHLIHHVFRADSAALREAGAQIWNASTLASELCSRLAPKLGIGDPGALATQVLLSFVGHLASASLLSKVPGVPLAGGDLVTRVRAAQVRLGVGPGELGAVMLRHWGVPETIVDEVAATDRMLVTPAGSLPAERASRLALAYLCARLGERLAAGDLAGLDAYLLDGDASPDMHHALQHLAAPSLARLPEQLHAPDVVQPIQTMLQGLKIRPRSQAAAVAAPSTTPEALA